jgi:hypothetical protein
MNKEDKMKNYKLTKKEAATILAKAWNNLDASLIALFTGHNRY